MGSSVAPSLAFGASCACNIPACQKQPRLLVFNVVIIMTTIYAIWAECMDRVPSSSLESPHGSSRADNLGIQPTNAFARGAPLDSWVITALVIMWNLTWLKFFWDIWGLLVDAVV